MKGFLDGVPVFFANQYAIGARARDEHWLVGGRRFVEKPVQILASLAGIHRFHELLLFFIQEGVEDLFLCTDEPKRSVH